MVKKATTSYIILQEKGGFYLMVKVKSPCTFPSYQLQSEDSRTKLGSTTIDLDYPGKAKNLWTS